MLLALAAVDHLVIAIYLLLVVGIGTYAARKQRDGAEFFLASRSLPWWAVGISIMATLMSSLTYLSEPGEVWRSGATNFLAKMFAIFVELGIVLFIFIPFLMRFRFTSAYEYLEHRFSPSARRLGSGLFCVLMISWLGFVVLSVARSLSHVAGVPLELVIVSVGLAGTVSTAAGGLRAVIWTEVMQFGLMLAGCAISIGYVVWATGSDLFDWAKVTHNYLRESGQSGVQWANLDPFARTSVFTAGMSMFVWNLVTHVGNQMMVQRYFSLSDTRSARRSFLVAQFFHVLITVLLTTTGLAIVYFYTTGSIRLGVDPLKHSDLIFPTFMVDVLPAGLRGAVLAAVLAAAMSMMDSGINALATVVSVERRKARPSVAKSDGEHDVRFARYVTVAAGLLITTSAYLLDPITREGTIFELIPRTFNVFVVPMGGMFLLGLFLPFCSNRGAIVASVVGLATSFSISYGHVLFGTGKLSFTLVMPVTLVVMFAVATLMRVFGPPEERQVRGLTWSRWRERPLIDSKLLAPEVTRHA